MINHAKGLPGQGKAGGHSVVVMPNGMIKIGGIEYSQEEARKLLFVIKFALQQAPREKR